jgi:ribonuclease D
VLAELRAWRESAARASLIDVRAVCTDETLARIADAEPSTEDELADIEGVGQMLARRAGSRILDAIRRGVSQSTDFADD